MLAQKKIAVIGVGKMGEALIAGLVNLGEIKASDITGTTAHIDSLDKVAKKLGIEISTDNKQAIQGKDIILLAVKPQNMGAVLRELAPEIKADQLVISIAASVTTSFIEDYLSRPTPVVRAIPNMPAVINSAITAICLGEHVQSRHLALAEEIFKSVGETIFVEENLMNGITALSSSGPAFVHVVIESLAEAGVKLGIPREMSTLLVARTMLGTAKMVLSSNSHPALLKDTVTTPAGCTIDGLMELEEGKLRVTLIKAVVKTAERAAELVYAKK